MSYTKQNFTSGQVLTAAHLNHMEDGIAAAEQTGGTASLTIGTVTSGSAASASITDGKLNLVLPTSSSGAGLSNKAQSLILTLFESAAYGNATMQTQLDALKTEWSTSGGTTEDPQNTNPFPSIEAAYLLPTAKTFVPAKKECIDTGVKLFETIDPLPTFTILFEVQGGSGLTAENSKYVLFHCMEESGQYPGLVVTVRDSGLQINLYTGQSQIGGISKLKAEKQRLAIRSRAGTLDARVMSQDYVSTWGAISGIDTTVDKTLLIGAMQESDGTKARFWNGTVYQCIVYQSALTDDQIMEWVNGQ